VKVLPIRAYTLSNGRSERAKTIARQTAVTSAMVGVAAHTFLSDGAEAMVDGDYLDGAIRSIFNVRSGPVFGRTKFKMSHTKIRP
jgi:hypothetical protein